MIRSSVSWSSSSSAAWHVDMLAVFDVLGLWWVSGWVSGGS